MNSVDVRAPQYRFEERVQRLMKRGFTREESEQIVTTVITTKENEHER